MIDVSAVRALLADVVKSALFAAGEGAVPVHPVIPDGTNPFPAVVFGMPSWEPGPNACFDRHEFPVAIVVEQPGPSMEGPARALDRLLPVVLDALKDAIGDGTLDGVAVEQHLTRAGFGSFIIAGKPFPAYTIMLTFHG